MRLIGLAVMPVLGLALAPLAAEAQQQGKGLSSRLCHAAPFEFALTLNAGIVLKTEGRGPFR